MGIFSSKNKKVDFKKANIDTLFNLIKDRYDNVGFYEEDININLSAVLWDTAELFIVAHEYSHIILGHLPAEKNFSKRFLDDNSMLYQVVRNWREEFSADALAFQFEG